MPFDFNSRDNSSNSKTQHSPQQLEIKTANQTRKQTAVKGQTKRKIQTKQFIEQQIKRVADNNLRLAKVFVSFMASFRSLRAAHRANITHCAADIMTGDPEGTDSNPAKQKTKPCLTTNK